MGRVFKKFTAVVGNRKVSSTARVDSGADVSIIRLDLARKLGMIPDTADFGVVSGVGAQRSVGYQLPATIKVGTSQTDVVLFVPVATVNPKTNALTTFRQKHNLLGMDFLQGSKTKLDYSRPHKDTFVGEVELLEITNEERAALAAWTKKYFRRK